VSQPSFCRWRNCIVYFDISCWKRTAKENGMLEVYERLGTQCDAPIDLRVILSHEQRDRGRMRIFSTDGEEVRLFLKRGSPLLVGEMLRSVCGRNILVEGAIEPVITVSCKDWEIFSRACYHLGNRHVKVQIGNCWLRILPDHVLEEMLAQLDLTIVQGSHVFIPEAGAYGHGGNHHLHSLAPVDSADAASLDADSLERVIRLFPEHH